jgi:hypothetical protein
MISESQFRFSSEELGLLSSVLNEVLNGFSVPDFDRKIGMKRADVENLLKHLHALGRGATTLDVDQTRAFRNALFETIRELGIEEFQTRTGYDLSWGNDSLKRLDRLLGSGDVHDKAL